MEACYSELVLGFELPNSNLNIFLTCNICLTMFWKKTKSNGSKVTKEIIILISAQNIMNYHHKLNEPSGFSLCIIELFKVCVLGITTILMFSVCKIPSSGEQKHFFMFLFRYKVMFSLLLMIIDGIMIPKITYDAMKLI